MFTIFIVFDGVGGSKRRKKIYKNYKANRANTTRLRRHDHHYASIDEEQEAMRWQFSRLVSYLDCLPVTFLSMDGIEADDTIAYIAQMYRETSKQITVVSTDRDFYQLVDDKIQIWSPIKKKMYDINRVIDEYGVHPKNYVMYRSFTGDKSDNIPGVSGIGPKTLLKHIPNLNNGTQYSLDALWKTCNDKLDESKTYQKILNNQDIISNNWRLMNLELLDIPAATKSNIRKIMESSVTELNKTEFRKLFMEDKMWSVMKNMPDWLNNTWLSLSSFAQQTK